MFCNYLCHMFGLDKLKEAKKKALEIKERLDNTTVEGSSSNGEVKVISTGNRRIVDVVINDSVFRVREQREIEQMITEATNNALIQAEQLAEAEMRSIMPNIPGL